MRIAALAAHRLAADNFPSSILKTKAVSNLDKELGRLLALKPHQGLSRIALEADMLDARAIAPRDQMSVLLEMLLYGLLDSLLLGAVAGNECQR